MKERCGERKISTELNHLRYPKFGADYIGFGTG